MIVDSPLDGEIIIEGGKASRRMQDFIEDVTRHINGTASDIYTVSTVPDATEHEGHSIYVSDETGGATLAFSDGTDWRRVQDRAVIS